MPPTTADHGLPPPYFLLARFSDFYEEVASIKLAASRDELASMLASADGQPPVDKRDYAARVSARLEAFLRQQAADVRRHCTVAEIKMLTLAQYVMAAVADEIFILDLAWPGREAWLPYLLEYKLFRTNNAGTGFFEVADRLLHTHHRSDLHFDAAAVFLLALQLGFKGQYRGKENEPKLRAYRERLYRYSEGRRREDTRRPAFEQAYRHRLTGKGDERLAPLSRWKVAAKIALAAYVAASTIVWVISLYPFVKAFGG